MPKLKPRVGSLDDVLAEHPEGRDLSLLWARALAITGDTKYKAFIAAYDADKSRDSTPLETFCAAAKVSPSDYYGMFAKMMLEYTGQKIDVIKAARLPEVVRASYDTAQSPTGFDDRHAILQQEGHHFTPKANQINIQQNQLTTGAVESMADFTKTLEELSGPRQLPAATTEFIDGSVVVEGEKVEVGR